MSAPPLRAMRSAAVLGALVLPVIPAAAAQAADPGLWIKTTQLREPAYYRQGLASDPKSGDVFFSGSFAGIYRTHRGREIATNTNPIPKDVATREQYNHIGDIAYDTAEGGRILLPLESYQPFQSDPNPSKTGSIGVLDAKTLRWKYYVKLDPAEIAKTQWVATDPAEGLVWTITDHDLLAYRLSDITAGNAAPGAAPIHSVRRLANAAPDGAGGAVVFRGRIYLSTQVGKVNQIVSVDPNSGASRVEFEMRGTLEAEGLDVGPYMGGLLHWGLVPGGGLSNTQVVNLLPKGAKLRLRLNHTHLRAGRKTTLTGTATVATNHFTIPVQGVQFRLAGKAVKTDASGFAQLKVKLTRGRYRAHAFFPGLRTATKRIRAT